MLKPCPFCGRQPYLHEFPGDHCQIGCHCGAPEDTNGPGAVWRDGRTFAEARERWNERSASPEPEAGREPVVRMRLCPKCHNLLEPAEGDDARRADWRCDNHGMHEKCLWHDYELDAIYAPALAPPEPAGEREILAGLVKLIERELKEWQYHDNWHCRECIPDGAKRIPINSQWVCAFHRAKSLIHTPTEDAS